MKMIPNVPSAEEHGNLEDILKTLLLKYITFRWNRTLTIGHHYTRDILQLLLVLAQYSQKALTKRQIMAIGLPSCFQT
jgi:hypothetical protein